MKTRPSLACDRLRRRVDDRRELPASDEWREWVALKTQYERAAALVGPELRRLALPKVDSDVCHLAVWLFNVRRSGPSWQRGRRRRDTR